MGKIKIRNKIALRNILLGILTGILTLIISVALLAFVIESGAIGEGSTSLLCLLCLFIAYLADGLASKGNSKKQWYIPAISIGTLWLIQLSAGILFIESNGSNLWSGMATAAVALAVVCTTYLKKQTRKGYKKLRTR